MLRGQIILRAITIWGNRIPQLSAAAVHVWRSLFTSMGDPSTPCMCGHLSILCSRRDSCKILFPQMIIPPRPVLHHIWEIHYPYIILEREGERGNIPLFSLGMFHLYLCHYLVHILFLKYVQENGFLTCGNWL